MRCRFSSMSCQPHLKPAARPCSVPPFPEKGVRVDSAVRGTNASALLCGTKPAIGDGSRGRAQNWCNRSASARRRKATLHESLRPGGSPKRSRVTSPELFSGLPAGCARTRSGFGGGKGIRTPDLLIANETLYQLSYTPTKNAQTDTRKSLAGLGADYRQKHRPSKAKFPAFNPPSPGAASA